MPAQTHGRVSNGFHIFANSKGRLTNLNQPPCNNNAACDKAYCCGPGLQPSGMKPQGCRRGLCSFSAQRGTKRSLALGGIGPRSAITKRAISRRVQNRNQMPVGYEPSAQQPRQSYINDQWPTSGAICTDTTQSNGGCACCLITLTKNHPRNVCLGTCKN